jgi:hypothetical protein
MKGPIRRRDLTDVLVNGHGRVVLEAGLDGATAKEACWNGRTRAGLSESQVCRGRQGCDGLAWLDVETGAALPSLWRSAPSLDRNKRGGLGRIGPVQWVDFWVTAELEGKQSFK